jgi:hypothetical protein
MPQYQFPVFLLFLCLVTQKIFSELDKTKPEHSKIYRSFQRTEEETEKGHRAATPPGGAACPWPAPTYGEGPLVHLWRRPFAYKDPPTGKT